MNNYTIKNILLVSLLLIGAVSCDSSKNKHDKPTDKQTSKPQKTKLPTPDFNEDSAYQFVKQQVDFGPRVPGTQAHVKCADYLFQKLHSFTDSALIQTGRVRLYDNSIIDCKNIIGIFNPNASKRILLCAHWDSRAIADHDPDPENHNKPIPGANDGASGVGVLIEIARQLRLNNTSLGVDIIFFDVEDQGEPQGLQTSKNDTWALGAQYWSKKPHTPAYYANYGILLDMVGVPNPRFPKEGFSREFAPGILDKVWNIANRIGYGNYFVFEKGNYITDDHYYVNKIRKIPTINIIHLDKEGETGFFKYWHTLKDDMESIDKNTLKIVGQTVLAVIFEENNHIVS